MSHIPCSNFNCNSTEHPSWKCPLPPICKGCHSDKHLWAACPEICMNCGTSNHKIDYCYDFEPGTCHKRWNFPRDVPLAWPYPISYKTDYEAIKKGDNRLGPWSVGNGGLLIPSPLTSRAPNESSQTAWTRPNPSLNSTNPMLMTNQPSQSSVAYFPARGGFPIIGNPGHLNLPIAPKGRVAELRNSRSTSYTTDLPILSVPNPMRAESRYHQKFAEQTDVLSQQRRLLVHNVPPAQTQKAIELLFYEFPVYVIAFCARPYEPMVFHHIGYWLTF